MCENRIKALKNTGLGKLPFFDFNANQAWAAIAALAMNLVAWLQLTALPTGHKASGWDMKRWWYRLFATAGKLITRARRTRLLIPGQAPETGTITTLLAATAEPKNSLRQRIPRLALKTGRPALQPPAPPIGDVEPAAQPATTGPSRTPHPRKPLR